MPTPATTRWRHDGLAVTETDALGRSTTQRLDALGRVLQVIDPALAYVDYEYDAFGNLVRVRDAGGSETAMTYDVRGFRRSIADPSAGRRTYDYSPLGELKSQTNARGEVTTFAAHVATAEGAAGMIRHAIDTHGRLDVLHNNATAFETALLEPPGT